MSYSILTIPPFDKQVKRLLKKYPSLKNDLINFAKTLQENPIQGTDLGENCYKIRFAIKSKGKGKSGGARIITNLIIDQETIYLISIYDKGEKETLTDKELKELLKNIPEL
jgi:mRNA-degrading endonuclease RelE of RelBE toxin-antitoxin system